MNSSTFLFFWLTVGYGVVLYGSSIQAVQPWGNRRVLSLSTALVMGWPFVMAALLVVLARRSWRRRWREAAVAIVLLAASVAEVLWFSEVNWWFRRRAVERAIIRARPVVEAIRQYEREHKGAPASLYVLVPKYLLEVPTTGMGAFPNFEYVLERWRRQTAPAGTPMPIVDPWYLRVSMPLAMSWDELLYYPSQRYPGRDKGVTVSRVGEWAYIHE
jgi:hypothetical protein